MLSSCVCSLPEILGCADFSWTQTAMSWFLFLFAVSLCGGNGLGGQCQRGTNLGLLDEKMMVLTIIYRPLPPSLLVPHLCVICDIYQSPLMGDILWGRKTSCYVQQRG